MCVTSDGRHTLTTFNECPEKLRRGLRVAVSPGLLRFLPFANRGRAGGSLPHLDGWGPNRDVAIIEDSVVEEREIRHYVFLLEGGF